MIVRGRFGRSSLVITLRQGSVTVGLDEHEVVAADRGGRLYSLYRDGHTWRRGLNGGVLYKWHEHGARGRRSLPAAEAEEVVDEASGLFARVLGALSSGEMHWAAPPDPGVLAELTAVLGLATGFDGRAAQLDAERFRRVYAPIGILPPDQYLALVLQATEGCSFGSCTFCDLYDGPYRVKSVAEFRRHVRDVQEYLGASLALRERSVFLGAANALAIPISTLLPLVDVMVSELGVGTARPLHAFVDAFTGARKSVADYRALAARGLRRVYIGLESGHDPLLAFVRKPGTASQAVETVRALKEAGINVGVIVIAGLGGDRFAPGHVAGTVGTLNAMRLGPGDLIYLSELVEPPGTAYPRLAAIEAIRPLDGEERRAQRERLRDGLVFAGPPPQMATYDVLEFVY